MALAHAILSLLSNDAYSGYEIAKQFQGSVGYFWQASHQQIYRELKKLEEQKLVKMEEISNEGPLNKKIYYITDLGEQKLAEWIDSETELGVVREDLLVKMFAGHLVDRQVLINQLEQQRRLYQKKLLKLQEKEKEVFHAPQSLDKEHFCQNLTLQMGFRYYQTWIDWCDESIEKLRRTE
jgi:DNA-binding PadR family transcriptional regulator